MVGWLFAYSALTRAYSWPGPAASSFRPGWAQRVQYELAPPVVGGVCATRHCRRHEQLGLGRAASRPAEA